MSSSHLSDDTSTTPSGEDTMYLKKEEVLVENNACCNTCPYCHILLKEDKWQCRFNAPLLQPTHIYGSWPLVRPDNWCGEHPDRAKYRNR